MGCNSSHSTDTHTRRLSFQSDTSDTSDGYETAEEYDEDAGASRCSQADEPVLVAEKPVHAAAEPVLVADEPTPTQPATAANSARPTFPPLPPSEAEAALVDELNVALKATERQLPTFPECRSRLKLLRFVRGHGGAALRAYLDYVDYREARDVDRVRAALLAAATSSGDLPWPYELPVFRPLLDGPWSGVPPSVHAGQDEHGNPITLTVFASYNLANVLRAGLGELWLQLTLHCDVYFDLLLHELGERAGRPVARHDIVDTLGVSLGDLTFGSVALLKRMGESSEHYPEMIARTSPIRMNSVCLTLYKFCKPFLPVQTASKMRLVGTDFREVLAESGAGNLPPRFGGDCTRHRATIDALPRKLCISARCFEEIAMPVLLGSGAAGSAVGEVLMWRVTGTKDLRVSGALAGSGVVFCEHSALDGVLEGTFAVAPPEVAGEPATDVAVLRLSNEHSRFRSKSAVVFFWVRAATAGADEVVDSFDEVVDRASFLRGKSTPCPPPSAPAARELLSREN